MHVLISGFGEGETPNEVSRLRNAGVRTWNDIVVVALAEDTLMHAFRVPLQWKVPTRE